jgi:acyl-CoA synthetase (AMP-forming)/AMP-acid ligase II
MRPIDYFDTAAELYSRETAVIDGDVMLSYGEVRHLSDRIAGALSRLSPGPDPIPVAVYSPNDYRVLAVVLGIMRAGGVIVPLHARNSVEVNVDVIGRTGPRCVFYHSSATPDVQTMKRLVPSVETWVCLDGRDGDQSLDTFIRDAPAWVDRWGDVCGNPDRPVYYWQTSGTTDRPKLVIDDCATFDVSLRVMRLLRSGVGAPPLVSLAVAPLSHAGGCRAFGVLTQGGTVVVMGSFDAGAVFANIERHRISDMWVPPSALALLLNYPDIGAFDISSLTSVELGASAVAPNTLREAVRRLGPCVSQTYGQIESGVVTRLDPATVAAAAAGDRPERLLSSGRTLFMNRWAIMSDDGVLLPPGETGEIVVRGRTVKRYLDPEQTSEARRYGWHHTTDLGTVDESGYLYVVGRKKDVIITGGFKVVAAEVERAILEFPEVHECAVVAAPDAFRGEAIKAIVVLKPGESVGHAELLARCRARLPLGKAPTSVEQWVELPKSAVGKIDKRSIRDRVWCAAPA